MFVSTLNPAPGCETSLATIMSRFLRSSLRAAFSMRCSVSAAKPTSTWPGRLAFPTAAAMSGFSTSSTIKGRPSCFFSFWSWVMAKR